MNILNRLTLKNLKMNKKRTVVTIVGIILSCALICGITTLIASFQQFFVEQAKITYGDYHVMLKNMSIDSQKKVKSNAKVEKFGTMKSLGFAELKESKNEYKPYLNIVGFDEKMFNIYKLTIDEGRLPENENEVVISNHIKNNGSVDYKVGDVLNLKIGDRYYKNEKIKENKFLDINETFQANEEKQYKIVGIIDRPNLEDYDAAGYTIITYADDNSTKLKTEETINIALTMKDPSQVYDFVEKIDESAKYSAKYNRDLLLYQGASDNGNVMNFMYGIGIFLILVIMFASISVIRNSFNISIIERLKQFGMLASTGATSKQIKKSVLFEGAIIGTIAIPIGVIAGVVGIGITLVFVNDLFKNLGSIANLHVVISVPAIIIAIVFVILTILLSVIWPARRASKISPMEAIVSSKDINIKGKEIKVSKLSKKIFGIEGEIALKNLKRSRKKYRTTVFSIVVSIVIFITFSSFVTYGLKAGDTKYIEKKYNMIINYNADKSEDVNEIKNKILELDGINDYAVLRSDFVFLDESYINEKYKTMFPERIETYNEDEIKGMSIYIYSLGDEAYNKYIKSIGGKIADYKDKGILINKNVVNHEGKMYETVSINKGVGDKIRINTNYKVPEEGFDLEIAKITDILPINEDEYKTSGGYIIVSDEVMDRIYGSNNNEDNKYLSMYLDVKNANTFEENVKKITPDLKNSVTNLDASMQRDNSIVMIVSIFFYGFIVVISLIGITNIFNTVTTNMALRSVEFAVFRSIGMTSKEFKKMINYESIFYGIKSLLIGLPVGIIMSYVVRFIFENIISTSFVFPLEAVIISIIFVFLIIFVTMGYSAGKIKKQNIIETIRNENI